MTTDQRRSLCALVALSGFACSSALATTWPFPGTPTVTSSFGDDENGSIHGGLDIPAAMGTNVRAVQAFTINTIWIRDATQPGGFRTSSTAGAGTGLDVFQVMGTDGTGRTHLYAHLSPPAGGNILVGQAVAEAANFARVRGGGVAFGGTFDHIHYNFSTNGNATAFGNFIDPLQNVFAANTVTDNTDVKHVTWNPLDNQFPIYGQQGSNRRGGRFVSGRLGIIAEIVDDMGNQAQVHANVADPRGTGLTLFNGISATPTEIRYEVLRPTYLPRGDLARRTLEKFDQVDGTHTGRVNTIYDATRNVTPDGSNTYNYNYNITQSNGTRPDGTYFWRTDAKKSGVGALGDGSRRAVADNNGDGAFPDGIYHLRTAGVRVYGAYLPVEYDVLVNNWNQTALPAPAPGVAPPAGGRATETQPNLFESTDSPFPLMTFNQGDTVYAMGSNYVDLENYTVYILPWQATWITGDSLANWISISLLFADANGEISSQTAWNDAQPGMYNIVIDYDRDGLFSWTQDGLGSFQVVPAPASLALLGLGALAATRRRRA